MRIFFCQRWYNLSLGTVYNAYDTHLHERSPWKAIHTNITDIHCLICLHLIMPMKRKCYPTNEKKKNEINTEYNNHLKSIKWQREKNYGKATEERHTNKPNWSMKKNDINLHFLKKKKILYAMT